MGISKWINFLYLVVLLLFQSEFPVLPSNEKGTHFQWLTVGCVLPRDVLAGGRLDMSLHIFLLGLSVKEESIGAPCCSLGRREKQ